MELKGDYTFDAPQDMVWNALNDPNVLGSVMPGSQGFEEVDENQYTGQLKVKVGPVQGVFDAKINLVDVKEPDSYTMEVVGNGNMGYVDASGGVELSPVEDDKTKMVYEGTAQVSGRIASVGQRLMDSTARSIVRQSLNGLNEYLTLQMAQQNSVSTASTPDDDEADAPENATTDTSAEPTEPPPTKPDYQAPSEVEVGLNVMRDVIDDLMPEQFQPVLVVIGLAIVSLILLRLSA